VEGDFGFLEKTSAEKPLKAANTHFLIAKTVTTTSSARPGRRIIFSES
jgi:hypothetical protein